jgi:hypothetical protein
MATSSIIGLLLLGFGTVISLLNWVYVYLSWRTGRHHSLIPLIGGVRLLIGALLVPSLRPFAWVAVFFDAGTIGVFFAVPLVLWEAWPDALCRTTQSAAFSNLSPRPGRATLRPPP